MLVLNPSDGRYLLPSSFSLTGALQIDALVEGSLGAFNGNVNFGAGNVAVTNYQVGSNVAGVLGITVADPTVVTAASVDTSSGYLVLEVTGGVQGTSLVTVLTTRGPIAVTVTVELGTPTLIDWTGEVAGAASSELNINLFAGETGWDAAIVESDEPCWQLGNDYAGDTSITATDDPDSIIDSAQLQSGVDGYINLNVFLTSNTGEAEITITVAGIGTIVVTVMSE